MTSTKLPVVQQLDGILTKIKRWETRAKRAANALAKLERQRRKLEKIIVAGPERIIDRAVRRYDKSAPAAEIKLEIAKLEQAPPGTVLKKPRRRSPPQSGEKASAPSQG